jgi:hypothetical protein
MIDPQFAFIRQFVRRILREAASNEWSLQGFGMLRLYLPGDVRLNVWDSRFRVPNVSAVHTHPWYFESLIVSGGLRNIRYRATNNFGNGEFMAADIKPGPGGGLVDSGCPVRLERLKSEYYCPGEVYRQEPEEIHESNPQDGCVTLNRRLRTGPDVAKVFWPRSEQWVSAEPRSATTEEILTICASALRLMEAE